MTSLLPVALLLAATPGVADSAYHTTIRFPSLPAGARTHALAADAAGNLFIVSTFREPSGRPQISVMKTDAQGNTLATLTFGGSKTGAGLEDRVAGAAVDVAGNVVIAGTTMSSDFPLASPLIANTGPGSAFIVKIDGALKNILISTKLGGRQGGTSAGAIALDAAGNIYVTGSTTEADFPVTPDAFQTKAPQSSPSGTATYAFMTVVRSDGKAVLTSTYFGDSAGICTGSASSCANVFGRTSTTAMALDAAGNVVIAGSTTAHRLPVTPGVFGPNCGDCASYPQANAGFVAKFSGGGSKLVWATYVPVASTSPYFPSVGIESISIDTGGNVIAAGTASSALTVTTGALQPNAPSPGYSGFVMKVDSGAQRLLFSTYFGGRPIGGLGLTGVAADPQGTIWISGTSPVEGLPASKGDAVLGESYLAALSADGSTIMHLFTAPKGMTGQTVILSGGGSVTAMGPSGALLVALPGEGPSLVAIANSAGSAISNAVAPYELVSLYGFGLGPQSATEARISNDAFPASLAGVQVLFEGVPAPILFAGPTQINAVVPSAVLARDAVRVQIIMPAGKLDGPTMKCAAAQPAVFTSPEISLAPAAVALNRDGTANSRQNPAALGSTVTVWASGTGASSAVPGDGTIVRSDRGGPILPVSVFFFGILSATRIGGFSPGPLSLEVLSAADAAGMVAGVSEIRFRLPAEVGGLDVNNVGFALRIGDAMSGAFQIYLKR